MWELAINGVDFYHIANWFYIYSFLGWLWETCYVSVRKGKLVNRGFINGPLCTIYGCGALAVYLILLPISDNLLLLFVGGVVVATALEYVTAVLMENIFHTSWWDYSDNKFNFQGRICLGCSLGWGLFTVGLFRVLHPVVEEFTELYTRRTGEIAVCVITVVYIVDFAFSAAAAFHLHERIPAWEQALDQMRVELLIQAREKMENLEDRSGLSREKLKKQLEGQKGRFDDIALIKELEEKRSGMMADISEELQKRKEAMAGKVSRNMQRFVKAYPELNRGYKIHRKKKDSHKSNLTNGKIKI